MLNDEIMVSVYMLTYQHVKYIKQALESVLMQKVSFRYEIVIGDDFSTDGTRDILIDYKNKYPDLIRLFLNNKNLGVSNNVRNMNNRCLGKYIAFLEGDDYWTDHTKLQQQVDFLENNPEYSAVYHDANIIGDDPRNCKLYKVSHRDISDLKDYFKDYPTIPTASLVMMNIFRDQNYDKYFTKTLFISDRITQSLVLRYGKMKYLDRKMSTYRYMTRGKLSFSSQDYIFKKKDFIKALKVQRAIASQDSISIINDYIEQVQLDLLKVCYKQHKYKDFYDIWKNDVSTAEKYRIVKNIFQNIYKRR
ncbi:MAG: hypothetical protein K0S47_797 [Herbinix sp.]|jgi:glycosyltransferase involved in cell wall biosynthesis|nr:hypothetical protein [Herbinix sp.]